MGKVQASIGVEVVSTDPAKELVTVLLPSRSLHLLVSLTLSDCLYYYPSVYVSQVLVEPSKMPVGNVTLTVEFSPGH